MAELVIKDNEIVELQNIVSELPTKFGVPLLNFFAKVGNARATEAKASQQGPVTEPDTNEG